MGLKIPQFIPLRKWAATPHLSKLDAVPAFDLLAEPVVAHRMTVMGVPFYRFALQASVASRFFVGILYI